MIIGIQSLYFCHDLQIYSERFGPLKNCILRVLAFSTTLLYSFWCNTVSIQLFIFTFLNQLTRRPPTYFSVCPPSTSN